MKHAIRTYGDPVLRQKAKPVEKVDDAIRALAKEMVQIMKDGNGVGLAAEQIGLPLALCVITVPLEYDQDENGVRFNPEVAMPLVLINPVITEKSKETDVYEEGCLSFPDITTTVRRPLDVTVKCLDLEGQPRELRLKRFIARVVQHEMDHLNGILIVDHMSYVKKVAMAGKLKRLKKETQESLAIA